MFLIFSSFDNAIQAYSSLGTSSPTNQLLFDPFINELARKYEKSNAQILLKFGLQVGW